MLVVFLSFVLNSKLFLFYFLEVSKVLFAIWHFKSLGYYQNSPRPTGQTNRSTSVPAWLNQTASHTAHSLSRSVLPSLVLWRLESLTLLPHLPGCLRTALASPRRSKYSPSFAPPSYPNISSIASWFGQIDTSLVSRVPVLVVVLDSGGFSGAPGTMSLSWVAPLHHLHLLG
jgi:hypothetical protein